MDLEGTEAVRDERRLVVLASSDGPVADLEFICGGNEENIEVYVSANSLTDFAGFVVEFSLRGPGGVCRCCSRGGTA